MGCRKLSSLAHAGRQCCWVHRNHHAHSTRGGCCKAPGDPTGPSEPHGSHLFGRCRRSHARGFATSPRPVSQLGFVGMVGNISLRLVSRLIDSAAHPVPADASFSGRNFLSSTSSDLSSLPSPRSSLLEMPSIVPGSARHILRNLQASKHRQDKSRPEPCSLYATSDFRFLPRGQLPAEAEAPPQAATGLASIEAEEHPVPEHNLQPSSFVLDVDMSPHKQVSPSGSADVPVASPSVISLSGGKEGPGHESPRTPSSFVSESSSISSCSSDPAIVQPLDAGLAPSFEPVQATAKDSQQALPLLTPFAEQSLFHSGLRRETNWTSGLAEVSTSSVTSSILQPLHQFSGVSGARASIEPKPPGDTWLPHVGMISSSLAVDQQAAAATAEMAGIPLRSPFESDELPGPTAPGLLPARGQPSAPCQPPIGACQPLEAQSAAPATTTEVQGPLAGHGRTSSHDITLIPTVTSAELHVRRPLGSGSFGSVFMMKPTDEVGFTAMKVLDGLERGPHGQPQPEDAWKEFEHEWEACRRLRHRNIVQFERVLWYLPTSQVGHPSLGIGRQRLCIEMEYCSLGSLDKLLRIARETEGVHGSPPTPSSVQQKYGTRFASRPDLRLSVARQVAAGLDYMHSKGLVHRDLRATNIVLDVGLVDSPDGSTGHSLVAKLCDFGATRTSSPVAGLDTADGVVISPKYQAPEVLLRNDYGPQSDVFSFGVLLWELVTLQQAWESASDAYVLSNVPRDPGGARPDWPCLPAPGALWTNPDLRSLVERCWAHDPSKRPSMKEVLKDLKTISLRELDSTKGCPSARRPSGGLPSPGASPPGVVPGPSAINVTQ